MSGNVFLQHCLTGISLGGAYALIAIGYTMVYGILRLINFAHGEIFMISGYIMIFATANFGWAVGLPITLICTVIIGVLVEKLAYSPLRNAPRMSVMISAIGVSYLFQNLTTYLFTALPKPFPEIPVLKQIFQIGDVSASLVTFLTPVITIGLVFVLVYIINHTKIGMAMRAVAKDFETSRLMGIKIKLFLFLFFSFKQYNSLFLFFLCISLRKLHFKALFSVISIYFGRILAAEACRAKTLMSNQLIQIF